VAFKDFIIPVSESIFPDPTLTPIDAVTDALFAKLGYPLLGGSSGRGWSYVSTAQRCGRLFQATYDSGVTDEQRRQLVNGAVPLPLQVGALFHTLQALHYAPRFEDGAAVVAPERKGLCALSARGPGRSKVWHPEADAAETFLGELKALCRLDDAGLRATLAASVRGGAALAPVPGAPSTEVVLEAEKCFDAHAAHWSGEDVTPLAIEWYCADEALSYTCRFDMIGRVGDNDPILPPGVYIFERKTAKWIDETYLESWTMDGEVLGQVHCWHHSDCERRFGKLAGVVMDVVGKGKTAECRRVVIPPDLVMTDRHARWVRLTQANIALWRAMRSYPQSFGNCFSRYGRCHEWENCAMGVDDNGA
jgi:hypothetical protein